MRPDNPKLYLVTGPSSAGLSQVVARGLSQAVERGSMDGFKA